MESRIPESTRSTLTKKGHKVQVTGPWSNGRVVAIRLDEKTGVISGVSSPRMETGYAMGW
jgi:gamma-glutamyltranspeptidase/glutathione hydrolase